MGEYGSHLGRCTGIDCPAYPHDLTSFNRSDQQFQVGYSPPPGFAQREKERNTRGTKRTQKAQKGPHTPHSLCFLCSDFVFFVFHSRFVGQSPSSESLWEEGSIPSDKSRQKK